MFEYMHMINSKDGCVCGGIWWVCECRSIYLYVQVSMYTYAGIYVQDIYIYIYIYACMSVHVCAHASEQVCLIAPFQGWFSAVLPCAPLVSRMLCCGIGCLESMLAMPLPDCIARGGAPALWPTV